MTRQEIVLRSNFLSEWTGQVTRVEPATGSTTGAPDVFLINQHCAGWVEFKSLDTGGKFEMRPAQRRWHRDFSQYSNASAFCILSTQGFWLINSKFALEDCRVIGSCIPWRSANPALLTLALRAVWFGEHFDGRILDDMIEPKIGDQHGHSEQEKQSNRPSRRAGGTLRIRS